MFKPIKKIIKYPRLTQDYPQKAPDARLFNGPPEITAEKCTSCGECVRRCPSGAMTVGAVPGINLDECIYCMLCEEVCPTGAVKMSNRYETAERDRNALRNSPLVIGGLPPELSDEELNARVSEKIRKVFGRSLQIREVDAGSCNGCDYEINALNNPFNDIERLGIHFVASPRPADMLLVTGMPSRNMEQALLKTYHATPDPKLVIAVGACACSGGIFRDSYASGGGIDSLIEVDAYIPGCPPRPQSLLYGILKVLERVK